MKKVEEETGRNAGNRVVLLNNIQLADNVSN